MDLDIAEMIQRGLDRKELTVRDAARLAGVDRSFLSRLRAGHRPPRTRRNRQGALDDPRYERIAEVLGIDAEVFLSVVAARQQGGEEEEAVLVDYEQLAEDVWLASMGHLSPVWSAALDQMIEIVTRAQLLRGSPEACLEVLAGYPRSPAALGQATEGGVEGLSDELKQIGDTFRRVPGPYPRKVRRELSQVFYEAAARDVDDIYDLIEKLERAGRSQHTGG